MARRAEAVARAIITVGRQVLCCQGQGQAFYHLPGGHLEAGEQPIDALIRELREELGREVSRVEAVGVFDHIYERGRDTIQETNHIFAVRLFPVMGEQVPRAQERHLSCAWIELDQLDAKRLRPPAVHTLVHLVGGL